MDVICTSQLVDLVPKVSRQADRRARMTVVQRGHPITLGDHRRQVRREFLEIELLLISRFDDRFMSLRVRDECVDLGEERIDGVVVLCGGCSISLGRMRSYQARDVNPPDFSTALKSPACALRIG